MSAINSSAAHRFWFGRLFCFVFRYVMHIRLLWRFTSIEGSLQNAYFMNFDRAQCDIPSETESSGRNDGPHSRRLYHILNSERCNRIFCVRCVYIYVPNRCGPIVWRWPCTSLTLNERRATWMWGTLLLWNYSLSVIKIRRRNVKRKQMQMSHSSDPNSELAHWCHTEMHNNNTFVNVH